MSDLPHIIAQMRRLYLHLLREGPITPDDMSRQIAALERIAFEKGPPTLSGKPEDA